MTRIALKDSVQNLMRDVLMLNKITPARYECSMLILVTLLFGFVS